MRATVQKAYWACAQTTYVPKSLLEMKSINFVVEKYPKVKTQTIKEPARLACAEYQKKGFRNGGEKREDK